MKSNKTKSIPNPPKASPPVVKLAAAAPAPPPPAPAPIPKAKAASGPAPAAAPAPTRAPAVAPAPLPAAAPKAVVKPAPTPTPAPASAPRTEPPAAPKPAAVPFALVAPKAREVYLVGSFNDWEVGPTRLRATPEGEWQGKLTLSPGRYEYLFVVDGSWTPDPAAKESSPNPFGGTNSVRLVF